MNDRNRYVFEFVMSISFKKVKKSSKRYSGDEIKKSTFKENFSDKHAFFDTETVICSNYLFTFSVMLF